jgi:hypothetical protein
MLMETFCQKLAHHIGDHDVAQTQRILTDLLETFNDAGEVLGEPTVSYKVKVLDEVFWLKELMHILSDKEKAKSLQSFIHLRKVI